MEETFNGKTKNVDSLASPPQPLRKNKKINKKVLE